MKLPLITEFQFDEGSKNWSARLINGDEDIDVSVPNDEGGISTKAYSFLEQVINNLPSLRHESNQYLRSFVDPEKSGTDSTADLIDVLVMKNVSGLVVRLGWSYQNDIYGLWVVEFSWDRFNKWKPVAFGRASR